MTRIRPYRLAMPWVVAGTMAHGVSAQQLPVPQSYLPPEVAEEVIAFLNEASTVRFAGRSSVPEGAIIVGDVGVLGGPFLVSGEVRGDVVVANGDVRFGATGRVDGNLVVVGGEVLDATDASVAGVVSVFEEGLTYTQRGGRLIYREPSRPGDEGRGFLLGASRFMIRSAGAYNRVEGLPILLGPVLERQGSSTTRFEAMALWRSESGLALNDELGYQFRLNHRLAGRPGLSLGASVRSRMVPIADWGLSDIESSLATFVFHKDFRDYYEQEGWSVSASVEHRPLTFTVEYQDERHAFAPVSSPWTLRRNDDPWRPQPLIAEGDIQLLSGELTIDTRNDRDRPSDGWRLRARLTRAVKGSLSIPEVMTLEPDEPAELVPAIPVDAGFATSFIDLRRYNRISPDADLNLRFVYGGAVGSDPLPAQYQVALGGEGTIPGYDLFSVDCGARRSSFEIRRGAFDDDDEGIQPAFGSYGCDRAILFQMEYRGRLSWNLDLVPDDPGDDWYWYPIVDLDPTWVAFFNVGRGWSKTDPTLDSNSLADLGVGFLLGDLGLYWAFPLTGEDRSLNFFVRLQRRF